MIPLKDENATEYKPVVTVLLIISCVVVYFFQSTLSQEALIELYNKFGVVPVRFMSLEAPLTDTLLSGFTYMFLHGNLLHLLGNMLYLWIFGNNIEDRLGHIGFSVFYVICGFSAAFAQSVFNAQSSIPLVGASGAIAGVLGSYLILFPRARIITLVILFFFVTTVALPAFFVIIVWFLLQLLLSIMTLGGKASSVAYLAHVGGFLSGLFLIFIFPKRKQRTKIIPPDRYYNDYNDYD